jgi:HK97 family phage portal protein
VASRAVALSYAARRLRNTGAMQQLTRQPGLGRVTRASILGLTVDGPTIPQLAPVTEDQAMAMPPFGRSVALIANALAGTDWTARRHDPTTGLKQSLVDQPNIVTDPSPFQTIWSYRWATAVDGILYGNHFGLNGELDWRTGRPGWIIPLPADQVWIMTNPGSPGWYQWVIGGETFDIDEIFHIPFGNRSGEILGLGVLQQYSSWLSGSQAAEEYSRDMFAAGALPPAVITVNSAAGQTDLDLVKQKWREIVSVREPVVLPTGTIVTPIVGNAMQSQLVEARTWNAQMAANVVGVPGWKLGLDGPTMTYQNVETGDIDFVRDSVDRWGRPITEAYSKWMLPAGTELAWMYESRMRADLKTTSEVYIAYKNAGIMTDDEVRAKVLNLPPLPAQAAPAGGPPNTADPAVQDAAAAAVASLAQAGVTPS